jgi:hypothetical protein
MRAISWYTSIFKDEEARQRAQGLIYRLKKKPDPPDLY